MITVWLGLQKYQQVIIIVSPSEKCNKIHNTNDNNNNKKCDSFSLPTESSWVGWRETNSTTTTVALKQRANKAANTKLAPSQSLALRRNVDVARSWLSWLLHCRRHCESRSQAQEENFDNNNINICSGRGSTRTVAHQRLVMSLDTRTCKLVGCLCTCLLTSYAVRWPSEI